jgi:hypothetical protein
MRFKLSYNWYRFMGITGLFLLGYIVIVGIFGNTDISPLLPNDMAKSIATHWPDLPFFKVQQQAIDDGTEKEVYFTVPTRQLTAKEIAALKDTGPTPKSFPVPPAKPQETKTSSSAQ